MIMPGSAQDVTCRVLRAARDLIERDDRTLALIALRGGRALEHAITDAACDALAGYPAVVRAATAIRVIRVIEAFLGGADLGDWRAATGQPKAEVLDLLRRALAAVEARR